MFSPNRSSSEELRSKFARERLFYVLASFLVFAWATWLRFRLPQEPMGDPDIWGYLAPALSSLARNGFTHEEGRAFLYPGFALAVLEWTRDLRWLSVVQHLLGLATGLFLLLSWNRARDLLADPVLPAPVWRWVGLIVTALYLNSGWTIYFEQEIRPEAIFPLSAILTIYFSLEYIWRRRQQLSVSWAAVAFGGGTLFSAVTAFLLKPSFGVTVLFATLPVWVALFWRAKNWSRQLVMVGVAAVFTWLLLLRPEARLAATDPASTSFVPTTLFTIHASLILRQMDDDLAKSAPLAYPRALIERLRPVLAHEIQLAATAPGKKYPSLGFNPDYLMYRDSFCRALPQLTGFNAPQCEAFYLYWYRRVWHQHPAWMLAKIGGQLHLFYRLDNPVYWPGHDRNFSERYQGTDTLMNQVKSEVLIGQLPFVQRWIAACTRLGEERISVHQPTWERYAEALLKYSYLPIHALLLGALIASYLVPAWRGCRALAWMILVIFLYNLGNCLGIAIVHSLEIGRYVRIQFIFTLLAQMLTLLLLLEMAARLLVVRRPEAPRLS